MIDIHLFKCYNTEKGVIKMLRYKIDVMQALKDKGYTTTRLREEKILGQMAMQKIRHGEVIGIIGINTLCEVLKCQPGKLIEWIPDEKIETE